MRLAMIGNDAVVMYDLYQPIEIRGCGRGRCSELKWSAADHGPRFRVTRFWGMEVCPHCGRPFGFARDDETFYLGDSLEDALETYQTVEVSLFGRGEDFSRAY